MADVFLPGVTDLFGDPIPASRGKKGRPAHVPTAENRRFVVLGLACGYDEAEIAAGLRINERTLKRHYFHELEGKQTARLRLEMKNMSRMVEQVDAGNVAAMSLLAKKLERMQQRELAGKVADRGRTAVKAPALGKKAAAKAAAAAVEGRFAPPAPPKLIH